MSFYEHNALVTKQITKGQLFIPHNLILGVIDK